MPKRSWPIWVIIEDLNNDTFLDIVVANIAADNVCILFEYSNGSFENTITRFTASNSQPWSIDIEDLNRDHFLDIVLAAIKDREASEYSSILVIELFRHKNSISLILMLPYIRSS